MKQQGPKEKAVRDGLNGRLAAIIVNTENEVNGCFAGFFNGARSPGTIFNPAQDFLFCGKSECEGGWGRTWRELWGELKRLGLLEWREEDVPCHDGSKMIHVHWKITKKGWEVREDDLKYFNELMDAMDAETCYYPSCARRGTCKVPVMDLSRPNPHPNCPKDLPKE